MAKKMILVLLVAMVAIGGVFAQDIKLSAGAGGLFTSELFGGGVGSDKQKVELTAPLIGGGGVAFFDATYAALQVGFFVGKATPTQIVDGKSTAGDAATVMGLDLALLGKYPIMINNELTVFPLLGAKYRVVVSIKDKDENKSNNPGDASTLFVQAGGGADYALSDTMYLRGQVLYDLNLGISKSQDDTVKSAKTQGASDAAARLGHGIDVNVMVGFRF
jgi:hypothetical protein